MRVALLCSEPLDLRRGSGTAAALHALRTALRLQGVPTALVVPRRLWRSGTLTRAQFNATLSAGSLRPFDAVLGLNGDGHTIAAQLNVPFVVLIKAFYAGAAAYERFPTKQLLRLHARWEALGAQRADAVVVPSKFAADQVVQQYHVASAAVHVIPEPFDAAAWRDALPRPRRGGTRVLCVAHLYPRKRVIDLIEAWQIVQQRLPGVRLDIAGDGPELRRLVHASRGLRRCYLHGHVDREALRELHARADVFVLPSAQETFGYAMVEAMAGGLPVVYADAGALPEVAGDAIGCQVAAADIAGLASAMITLLTDDDARNHAAQRNPNRAAAFAPQACGAAMVDLLSSLARSASR